MSKVEFQCVCIWLKHTTTAVCHFSLSTHGHLFWIKWCPPPIPSALLCIYHVVYSKVIFSMGVTYPMCCSTTNHRASDECDNAQDCRPFPVLLSPVISLQIGLKARHWGEKVQATSVLTAPHSYFLQQGWTKFCDAEVSGLTLFLPVSWKNTFKFPWMSIIRLFSWPNKLLLF